MDLFHLFSVLIVLAALFSFINFRYLKLPNAIGLMLVSLLFSFIILIAGNYFPVFKNDIVERMNSINFSELVLEGMLSFLLFAGAIHIKIEDLRNEKLTVLLFSTISVLISTIVIGISAYYVLNVMGIEVTLVHSMLFGSLISPTDPIAVLSILKSAGVSKSLETKIAGESLFNDGVAVVIFLTILNIAKPGATVTFESVAQLFVHEAIGGLILGAIIGYAGYKLIASIDNYQVEVLLTLAIVMGGYTLAHFTHVSGPLAMVVAGLVTGNKSKKKGMSDTTAEYVDKFWELIDAILNAVLFVLIGLELLVIEINKLVLIAAVIILGITLITRYISVYIPSIAVRFKERMDNNTLMILTWGGLRGGISIALALSIAPEYDKDVWVTITYVIVCFSILVQGTTIGSFAKKIQK